ncbi:YlbF family regulator [Alkalihalobacillus sp. 1P02AB]|uniref:YlbF family regulator n=1 Tax=Alkalihalobacillus sp. 1P02AB TaxID=3132260 RepID=UPI0039A7001D
MLATMTMVDLIEEASDLAQAISESEVFVDYVIKKKQLEQDKEAQKAISDFNRLKDQYEEVQRFGKYHPDYKEVSSTIRQTKRKLDLIPTVMEFKKAEKELEQLLNEVSGVIAHSVSQTIKVPTGNPFFDQMSCSGGCGSGGSCSCG